MKHRTKALVAVVCALALAGAFALVGCSGSSSSSSSSNSATSSSQAASSSSQKVELQIFAANSLEKALPEVQALYTQKHPNVTFSDTQFKASGDLVAQLQSGASADAFIAASTSSMDSASKNGSIDDSTRADMFLNDLVVCASQNSGITISSVEDLGTSSDVNSIAIGEPNTVPAGKYAVQSLETAGLCTTTTDADGKISVTYNDSVANKMNDGADKVGTVASYVKQGQCDVGFVYSSDIYRYDGIQAILTVPANYHKAIKYPGAVCTSSKNAETAKDFLNFCTTDPEAQQIFAKYGFELA